jgi:C-terminal processing protease CtpA/Prc
LNRVDQTKFFAFAVLSLTCGDLVNAMEIQKSRSFLFVSHSLPGVVAILLLLSANAYPVSAQKLKDDRETGHEMLDVIKDDLKKKYYDSSLRGLDIDARFKAADELIDKANSAAQVLGIIAQTLMGLNDSHTFLLPPGQTVHVDYGWDMKMIGARAYIVKVKPGSEAEIAGVRVGDSVESVEGIKPTRETVWKIEYLFNALRPQSGLQLFVRELTGRTRLIDAKAEVWQDTWHRGYSEAYTNLNPGYIKELRRRKEILKDIVVEEGDTLAIWKLPRFNIPLIRVDEAMKKIRKHDALILDLRANGGGAVVTLKYLVGYLFDHDIKLADRKTRTEVKADVADSKGKDSFKGKLIVLVDSESASAAEIFARLVQLEKRGIVIGDQTAGAVMEAQHYFHRAKKTGFSWVDYGASITVADLIMGDGKSLEHAGVTPDEILYPTAVDLALKRDPVLSRAAKLLGVAIEADKAGALFPEPGP